MCSSNTLTVFARMSDVRQQSITGIKWGAVQQFSSQLIHFVLGLLIARILLPEDYGIIGMLAIFMSISQSIVDSGFSQALIRKIDRTETDCSTVFYFNIVVGFILYLLLFISAPYIALFYEMPVLKDIIRVYSLTIFFNSLAVVPRALRTIAIDFKSQAYASMIASGVSGIVGLYLAYNGFGVWALVWQSILGTVLSVLLIWIYARWKPSLSYSWQSFQSLFSFGSKLLLSSLLHRLYSNMSLLLIGKYYTPAELGTYTRGEHLANLPTSNITNLLQRVTYPILARLQNDDERLITIYRKYVKMTSLVVFFIVMFLCATAKPIVTILLTEKWLKAVPFFQIFCLSSLFHHIIGVNLNLLKVKGHSDLYLKIEIVKKVIIFPILFLAIPFGPMAICWVSVIYTQVDLICDTYYSGKLFGFGYFSQLHDIRKYLIVAVLACTPAFFISLSDLSPFLSFMLSLICSIVLYVTALHRDIYLNEIVGIVKQKRLLNKWR